MPSRFAKFFGAAACCALLASCGGGGDTPSPTPTPTPTGTGTGTPTPTGTATPTPVLEEFDFSEDIVITSGRSYIYAYFTPNNGGTEVWSDGRLFNQLSGFSYETDPEIVKFRFNTAEDTVEFQGADRTTATPTLRIYSDSSGRLILETPFEHVLRATYERTDPYIRATVPGTLRSRRVVLYANSPTVSAALTSPITYTGTPSVVGGVSGQTPASAISSTERTFTLSPTGPTLTGTIPIFETVNGVQTQRATLSITATVSAAGTFAGTVTDAASGFSGQYVGTLAGPGLAEVALTFSVSHSDGRKYVGSFIGG